MKRIVKGTVVVMVLAMMSVTACANSDRGNGRRAQGPPPEAITACEGKEEGDEVTFAGRGGESLSATCQTIEGQLAAVPKGHSRRQ